MSVNHPPRSGVNIDVAEAREGRVMELLDRALAAEAEVERLRETNADLRRAAQRPPDAALPCSFCHHRAAVCGSEDEGVSILYCGPCIWENFGWQISARMQAEQALRDVLDLAGEVHDRGGEPLRSIRQRAYDALGDGGAA